MDRQVCNSRTWLLIRWSDRIGACRFPEFNAVALRITKVRKASVWIHRQLNFNGNACRPELRDHRIEIADAKIDSPGMFGATETPCILRFGSKYRRAFVLPPGTVLVCFAHLPDSEVLLIPVIQLIWVLASEEEPSDACHSFHIGAEVNDLRLSTLRWAIEFKCITS